ncbi:hypothetical protein A2U01_0025191, partial [Trifolium medium]|nr:hypothetical protein [Trifolium medium]
HLSGAPGVLGGDIHDVNCVNLL